MPELPEVEICARELSAALRGKTLRYVEAPDHKIHLPPDLAGRRITEIFRRGKFIVIRLDDDRRVLIHLGMTGWFERNPPRKYRMALAAGDCAVYLEDPRRFGNVRVISAAELEKALGQLGPEPLAPDFDLSRLKKSHRPVKVALHDQHLIAGIGNIYANEALWRARIHPKRLADRLPAPALRRLRAGIVAVLRKAIAYGPRIFEAQRLAVYGRKGKPCRRCRTPIQRAVFSGRSAYYCPRCQR